MFVVSRHKGQRITIGEGIEIVVLEVSRSNVKLGVIAPKSLTILRSEVREQIEEANREAASAASADTSQHDELQMDTRLSAASEFLSAAIDLPSGSAKTETSE